MRTFEWISMGIGALVALVLVGLWIRTRIRYRIGRGELRIRLFGATLRRIRYADIERISKPRRRHGRWGYENWSNTLHGDHRELVVHRRSGMRRKLLITPANRYEFRKSLEKAIGTACGAGWESPVDADERESGEEPGPDVAT
jgi:hypothetical protein